MPHVIANLVCDENLRFIARKKDCEEIEKHRDDYR